MGHGYPELEGERQDRRGWPHAKFAKGGLKASWLPRKVAPAVAGVIRFTNNLCRKQVPPFTQRPQPETLYVSRRAWQRTQRGEGEKVGISALRSSQGYSPGRSQSDGAPHQHRRGRDLEEGGRAAKYQYITVPFISLFRRFYGSAVGFHISDADA